MELVPSFMLLLQGLSATMTVPTFANLTTVVVCKNHVTTNVEQD